MLKCPYCASEKNERYSTEYDNKYLCIDCRAIFIRKDDEAIFLKRKAPKGYNFNRNIIIAIIGLGVYAYFQNNYVLLIFSVGLCLSVYSLMLLIPGIRHGTITGMQTHDLLIDDCRLAPPDRQFTIREDPLIYLVHIVFYLFIGLCGAYLCFTAIIRYYNSI